MEAGGSTSLGRTLKFYSLAALPGLSVSSCSLFLSASCVLMECGLLLPSASDWPLTPALPSMMDCNTSGTINLNKNFLLSVPFSHCIVSRVFLVIFLDNCLVLGREERPEALANCV